MTDMIWKRAAAIEIMKLIGAQGTWKELDSLRRDIEVRIAEQYAVHHPGADVLRQELEAAKEKYAAAWELCAEIELELFGPSDMCPDLQAARVLIGNVVLPPYTPERHTWKVRALAAEARVAELEGQKNAAYVERNQLVAFLSRLFSAHLARHDEADTEWEDDWRNIVCIHLPAGQATWHIHDSELPLFAHLGYEPNHWDGHTNEEKYRRVAAVASQSVANSVGEVLYELQSLSPGQQRYVLVGFERTEPRFQFDDDAGADPRDEEE